MNCICPRVDGYRIRRGGCPAHDECLDSVGPVPKLDGATFVCTRPKGHDMPHEAPDGTWWERKDDKPAEPTGLGAVVEDVEGERWVRVNVLTGTQEWRCCDFNGAFRKYADITAVRILSPGVEA